MAAVFQLFVKVFSLEADPGVVADGKVHVEVHMDGMCVERTKTPHGIEDALWDDKFLMVSAVLLIDSDGIISRRPLSLNLVLSGAAEESEVVAEYYLDAARFVESGPHSGPHRPQTIRLSPQHGGALGDPILSVIVGCTFVRSASPEEVAAAEAAASHFPPTPATPPRPLSPTSTVFSSASSASSVSSLSSGERSPVGASATSAGASPSLEWLQAMASPPSPVVSTMDQYRALTMLYNEATRASGDNPSWSSASAMPDSPQTPPAPPPPPLPPPPLSPSLSVDEAEFELSPRSLERSLDGLLDGLLGEVDALILGHSADSAAAVPSSPSTSPRRGRASSAASGAEADPADDEDDAMSTIQREEERIMAQLSLDLDDLVAHVRHDGDESEFEDEFEDGEVRRAGKWADGCADGEALRAFLLALLALNRRAGRAALGKDGALDGVTTKALGRALGLAFTAAEDRVTDLDWTHQPVGSAVRSADDGGDGGDDEVPDDGGDDDEVADDGGGDEEVADEDSDEVEEEEEEEEAAAAAVMSTAACGSWLQRLESLRRLRFTDVPLAGPFAPLLAAAPELEVLLVESPLVGGELTEAALSGRPDHRAVTEALEFGGPLADGGPLSEGDDHGFPSSAPLFNLTLVELRLRRTAVSGSLRGLAVCSALRVLDLAHTAVSGEVGDLAYLTCLEQLWLDNTNVGGGLHGLARCDRLHLLSAAHTRLSLGPAAESDAGDADGGGVSALRHVDLTSTPVVGSLEHLLAALGGGRAMGCLEHLDVTLAKGLAGDVGSLAACVTLKAVGLRGTSVQGDLADLAGLASLEHADLRATAVTDATGRATMLHATVLLDAAKARRGTVSAALVPAASTEC